MDLEIGKAYKRRQNREKKKQEQIDLAPVRSLQPKIRSVRYDNMKSAMAEEGVLSQILREPALLDQTKGLTGKDFSVELLGRAFDQLSQRHSRGQEVSLAVLSDFTPEEMSHLTMISQKQQGPVSETALRDCISTIRGALQAARVASDDDLLAFRNKLKESKGTKA